MADLDLFGGHLRQIAEMAGRLTPRLVSMCPRVKFGRTVVYVVLDTCSSAIFVRLLMRMDAFCKREGIPPDYVFSRRFPAPGLPPPGPSPRDLPGAWPPEDE